MSVTSDYPSGSSIIDNRNDNKLLAAIQRTGAGGKELWIATAFFSLDALVLLADTIETFDRVRILFGDDASPKQRKELLNKLQLASDSDLLQQREVQPLLSPLKKIEAVFKAGKVEARCYTKEKFHAKAYVFQRPDIYPNRMGILGSGNFTRPGLTQNIELNVELTPEQTAQLETWFEERWAEAVADVVTEDLLGEVKRQIDLYDPYIIYLKALLLWGQYVQGDGDLKKPVLYDILDPHQQHAYNQALKILERNNGVMVCDGVGLGKSYIALALMEKLCRDGERILLLAPKSILESSWQQYLQDYLEDYQEPFGSFRARPMTDLGFLPEGDKNDTGMPGETLLKKRKAVRKLAERATVIVVDESHNFRTTSASRYRNLELIARSHEGKRKKVILLTATPINNSFRDISAQLSFITQDKGDIGGFTGSQITRFANTLDKNRELDELSTSSQMVLSLFGETNVSAEQSLRQVLEQVVIQRSRRTCKEQSQAAGRPIHFPVRQGPVVITYQIGRQAPGLAHAIDIAEKRFRPLVHLLKEMRELVAQYTDKPDGTSDNPDLLPNAVKYKGIKLAAYLPAQYNMKPKPGEKVYQDEVRLAGLVYANTLKQLESSLPAFQGILQSLAKGLIARLEFLLADDARQYTQQHLAWVQTPIFNSHNPEEDQEDNEDIVLDGENLDISGGEADSWIDDAIRTRKLERKLAGYNDSNFRVDKWREDIVNDLGYLHEIHTAVLNARTEPDPKLERLLPEVKTCLEDGKKVLIFTQSQRTAEYLEREFKHRLPEWNSARIDSRVESTRAAILHAFCPGYNPEAGTGHKSIPVKVDLLISTDVLSEGVNLQEAGAIFNWDIHWNPVRLIQRIGRVDRRLNPEITPLDHSFTIFNVLPPDEIERIIKLVGAVENRTLNISRAVGVDLPFFQPDDPAGNLKEFNAFYEGKTTARDDALTEFIRVTAHPPERWLKTLHSLPAGAFGVWDRAPFNGLFALFTMEATKEASDADREKYATLLGRPVMALLSETENILEAGEVLAVLGKTTEGQRSGSPSDEKLLASRLSTLKNRVRQQFATIELPGTIKPRLVCWMELKKD